MEGFTRRQHGSGFWTKSQCELCMLMGFQVCAELCVCSSVCWGSRCATKYVRLCVCVCLDGFVEVHAVTKHVWREFVS